jgi:hypothetical protein
MACSVYFIQAETTKFIKIGVATNPNHRLQELQVGNPDKLRTILTITLPDSAKARQTEQELHKHFEYCRARGEWFKADPVLVSYINTWDKSSVLSTRSGATIEALSFTRRYDCYCATIDGESASN